MIFIPIKGKPVSVVEVMVVVLEDTNREVEFSKKE